MGLPICRDTPADSRETERDPTASARSHIRRRLHRRRNGGTSDILRRNRLDQDRRSSQQVLLDLLQYTSQDNNSSSSVSTSALSSAATTASSTVNATSLGAGSPATPPPWYRRDPTAFPSLMSNERDRRDQLDAVARATPLDEAYIPLPSFLSPGLRIIRHSPVADPSLPVEQEREEGEQERDREPEREHEMARLRAHVERNRERNERFAREFRNRHNPSRVLWSTRLAQPSNLGPEERASYIRESTRRVERATQLMREQSQLMHTMSEQFRELNSAIPDLMGVIESRRGRGSRIDGLGDRERSLSPDPSPWYSPDPLPVFPELGMHCEYASDGESEGDEERPGWTEPASGPSTRLWGEVSGRGADPALERFRSRRAALLRLRDEVNRIGGNGEENPMRVNITGEN